MMSKQQPRHHQTAILINKNNDNKIQLNKYKNRINTNK